MGRVIPFVPAVRPAIIPEEGVTIASLMAMLEAAYFDHELDGDGGIYLREGIDFPLWIHLMPEQKLLKLVTFFPVDDQPDVDWIARANELNCRIEVPQFCYARDNVWASYWMTYAGGLHLRHFVKMMRRFSSAVQTAISLPYDVSAST